MTAKYLLFSLVLSALLLAGCGNEPEFPNKLLRKVPADTPYLSATGKPMPKALADKLSEVRTIATEQMLSRVETSYEKYIRDAKGEKAERAAHVMDVVRKYLALVMTPDGRRKIGIHRDDDFVLYGYGVWPVMRVTVSEPDAFRSFLNDFLEAIKAEVPKQVYEGTTVRRLTFDRFVVLAGLKDGVFSAAFVPAARKSALLTHLFSEDAVEHSLAETGKVPALMEEYGFEPYYVGYLDTVRLAELLLQSSEGAGPASALGKKVGSISKQCRAQIIEYVSRVPRIVYGVGELTAERMAGSVIVDLEPELAKELAGWSVPVPGLGRSSDAFLGLGYGLDITEIADSIRGWMQAMAGKNLVCAAAKQVDWQAKAAKINAAPLYMAGNPQGLVFTLTELSIESFTPFEMGDLKARVVFYLGNPQMVANMAKGFLPSFGSLNLSPDGTPVNITDRLRQILKERAGGQSGLASGWLGRVAPVFAARTKTELGLSVGADEGAYLHQAITAEPAEPTPVAHLGLDAEALYSMLVRTLGRVDEELDKMANASGPETPEGPDSAADMQAKLGANLEFQRKLLKAYSELYDRIIFDVYFNKEGIVFHSAVTLQ